MGNTTSDVVQAGPTTTVATGQKTVATIVSVPTTSVPGATKSEISTTTTVGPETSTTTVATEKKSEKLSAIDVPNVDTGGAALRVAGKEVPVTISREDNSVLISAVLFNARFSGQQSDGSVISLDSEGNIRVKNGDSLKVTVTGFAPESEVEVRLYSDPILLGRTNVDKQGTMLSTYRIPEGVASGAHRVVLVGKNYNGDTVTFAAGIMVGAVETTSWALRLLIAFPLGGAVLVAMFLPAILRRRKREEDEASGQ